jgi:hypothetical protein
MKVLQLLYLCLVFSPLASTAQTVQTSKESSRIEGTNIEGYQVSFDMPEEEVQSSLNRYLKAFGKIKISGDYITISHPVIDGKEYAGTLYATTKHVGNTVAAWMGLLSGSGEESAPGRGLEKLVYDFGVAFYRQKIQVQVDESLRALQAVERQQQRLVSQNKDLNSRIENNKAQKIQLERSLVENKLELERLILRLEDNTVAQDSVAVAGEQIKKVVEMHKERQRNVH